MLLWNFHETLKTAVFSKLLDCRSVTPWCSGYHYCKLHSAKSKLRFCAGSNPAGGVSEIRDGEVPTGNKDKSLSSVNHTT